MINKKEFDLLLQEVFQIENKIEEMKVLNHFDEASEYNGKLEEIKTKAKNIIIDNDNKSQGFDELSLEVLAELILLDSNVDYYVLKTSNTIASAQESKIDAEALKKIKQLWDALRSDLDNWEKTTHNPIKEIEHNKQIGKTTLDIIIYKLQVEAVIDFTEIFRYCQKEFLINAIKEVLFEGAKNEDDLIQRKHLIDWAKIISEKDLYDYKLWQQILAIKNLRSRDDHIEMIGSILDKDNRKYDAEYFEDKIDDNEESNLELYDDGTILFSIKNWFKRFTENAKQKKMTLNWESSNGPAFKAELIDNTEKFAENFLDKSTVKNVKKLTIATPGVAKYHFEKGCKFENLEEIEFLNSRKVTSGVNLSPDKTYKCIGSEAFENCPKLETVYFGKIEMIGERAFKDCKNLSKIVFTEKLKHISEDAFLNCEKITSVEFVSDLDLFILGRPQNVLNCFKGTNLEEIIFPDISSAFNFAIADCPNLKRILIANIPEIQIPFKTCRYRLGRQEGIVSFVGEKSLNLWKKKNSTVRFFELIN